MAFRIQLSADFKWSRLVGVLVGLAIPLCALTMMMGADSPRERGFIALGFLGSGAFIFAAILLVTNGSWLWFRPFGKLFGGLFYPEETITQPPKDLLFSLRMRLRDRFWESVDQQTRELIRAYGPSPELYHLRALMEGGRSGNHSAVTVEASKKLSGPAFDRYTALLRRDPPPSEIQTGIEA